MDEYKDIRAYRIRPLHFLFDWCTIMPYLLYLKRKTASHVRLAYLGDRKQIEQDIRHGAFFITNHRDICLDSAWLSLLLRLRYFIRPYIGIGNNLFGRWWIEPLVRSLRCFVVIRNAGLHDQLRLSMALSHYIRDIRKANHSIWLAQREGRAKDGNDLTSSAVLKMLTLDAEDFFERVKQLNFCPVSISYEYDPCDYLKAREAQLRRDNPAWRKSQKDDLISMSTGLNGWKGDVVYRLTPSINPELDAYLAAHPEILQANRNEQIAVVARLIDRHIHLGYEEYERGTAFASYLEQQIDRIHLSKKDPEFLRERLLEMYANPIKNKRNAECVNG